jgi:hypothetical protein
VTRDDRHVVFWARGKGGKDGCAKRAAGADEEDVFVWWHRGDGRSYLMSVGSDLFRVSIGGGVIAEEMYFDLRPGVYILIPRLKYTSFAITS